ncbi:MAG: TRAP transporter small permease [Balneolaceae bacterium]|nr:TRAP transporter small permease [Balneolaceae bacterium]MBO6547310.1 TRAP transporter small permease [Balneolaceae bacterium]MBO6647743.1 TRAP transporter small permease [Balneolaceae bacterium]
MNKLTKFLEYFLAFLMALMLFSVCWQVISRYVLSSPSSFTDELARYLLIWIGLLGGAYASGKGMHLAIDLLPAKLKGKSKSRLQITIHTLILVFVLCTFVLGGVRLVYITYTLGQTSAAMQIPLAYVYIIVPVSGLLIISYKARDIISLVRNSEEVTETSNQV